MAVTKVGCLGLGNMGAGIAHNLHEAGFELAVFDVRADALQPLVSRGARAAISPRDLARGIEVLAVAVVDDDQVRAVVLGESGALAGLDRGAVLIIHSTVSPSTCRELEDAAREHGVAVLDAALSGGEGAARAGTLTLMIGGASAIVERCAPVFDAISSRRFHVGATGAGQVAKLVNNTMALVNRIVATEALSLAVTAGLDVDATLELVGSGTGASWQVEHWRETQALAAASVTGPEGMEAMARKDLRLALQLAGSVGAQLPVTERATDHTTNMFGSRMASDSTAAGA